MSPETAHIFIRCPGHRQRQQLQRLLGYSLPAYFSWSRTAHGGILRLDLHTYLALRLWTPGPQGLPRGCTLLRPPYDDLHPCPDYAVFQKEATHAR